MKTTVEKLEDNKVLLKVEVSAKAVGTGIARAYKSVAEQATIPGFRKGKIPRQVIDMRIGKGPVYQEALENMVPTYWEKAVKENDIEPIDKPEVEIVQIEEGKPLIFNAKFEVKPEVALGEYVDVEVEKPRTELSEEEIEKQLEGLQDRFASLESAEDKALEEGDFALISYEGFVDGEPFEGGSADDFLLEVGSDRFMLDFEKQLVGMKPGEKKEVEVDVPEDNVNEQVAGKKVKFQVELKEVKTKKLPPLDDQLAKQVGGFETLDELKQDLIKKGEEYKLNQAEHVVRDRVVNKVAEEVQVDVPEIMIEHQVSEIIGQLAVNLKSQGMDIDDYLKMSGLTKEQARENVREDARKRVKQKLVLEAVAKKENIKVEPEEMEAELAKLATEMGKDLGEVRKLLQEQNTLGILENNIQTRKTIDWLTEKANIVEEKEKKTEKQTEKSPAGKAGKQ